MEDPAEQALLAAIVAGDHASRAIYADWLEQRGNLQHAEFLRLNEETSTIPQAEIPQRLTALATGLDLAWKAQVARPLVIECEVISCPRDWGLMIARDGGAIRHCRRCELPVHYCTSGDHATTCGHEPVVFDAAADQRWTCPPCGTKNPWETRFCGSCGMRRPNT